MIAVYGPWAAECALEVIGALLYFKRSKILSAYFAVTALMDVITFAIFQNFSRNVYSWSTWTRHGIRNMMLLWIGCAICGMFVSERRRDVNLGSAFIITLGAIGFCAVGMAQGKTIPNALLDGEVVLMFVLLGVVALGWISRRGKLNQAWKWIVAGFMVMVGSDLLFTALWMGWDGARHWYPLGAIAAQLIWCVGPLRAVKLPECRADLGKRISEAERISVC